ncbi:MAG: ketol-acid reductoisomerase [Candidatus Zipacnadales bacterium]
MYEYRIISDDEATLEPLLGKTMAVIGYGNQGRAQALNMRDSGLLVLIGNPRDSYLEKAVADGFEVLSCAEAAARGDVIFLLIPDEAQKALFEEQIAPGLQTGNTLCFAHGYNLYYELIEAPADVDVVMVAPRMIGVAVRDLFLKGSGASAYCAVHQDATGNARAVMLAIAKAIGATRVGSIESSVALETELDLFMEQATWAALMRVLTTTFEVLVEAGFPPEIVCHETWGSHEAAEILEACATTGLFGQMGLHSQTSQYGQLSRSKSVIDETLVERFRERLREIRDGTFAREWEMERLLGYPVFKKLRKQALSHPINEAERKMWKMDK